MKLVESMIAQGVLCGFFLGVLVEGSPLVVADMGPIEGYYKNAENGRRYEAFEGISYAEPPVDDLRFEPPKSYTFVSPSKSAVVARKISPVCMQYDEAQKKVIGREDCLYLNIYRPDMEETRNHLLPVIFFIHGNDFQSGSGGEHGPRYLMERDVILVTFNYRLGALGFLSTEDDVVPGNMGLKDQVLALRWVQDNIMKFNGDPDNVAIFGHGAGGASVHYHYLTKQTEGLFHKGMSLSGTALAPWALAKEPRKKAFELAELVNCPTNDMTAMVNCLKNKPASTLVQSIAAFRKYMKSPFAPFGPVVEKGKHEWKFIGELPSDIITSSRAQNLPWITGFVDLDALAVASGIVANPAEFLNLNANWSTIAPDLLEYRHTASEQDHEDVARLVKEHYLETSPITPLSTVPVLKMIGDRLFVTEGAQAALLQAQFGKGPIRFYRFSYRGDDSFSTIKTHSADVFRAAHKDDLAYIFDLPVNMSASEDGRIMRQLMINLWVSYAEDKSHSKPKVGIEWPSINPNGNEIKYLHILEPDETVIKSSTDIGQKSFWGSLGFDENRVNVAPA